MKIWEVGGDAIQSITLTLLSMKLYLCECVGEEKIVGLTAKDVFLIAAFAYKIRNSSPYTKENGDLSDITRLVILPRIGRIFLVHEGWKVKIAISNIAEICASPL